MSTSLNEQLRSLLRDTKRHCLERHQAFGECEDGFARRRDVLERSWQEMSRRIQETYAQEQSALRQEFEESQQGSIARHDEEHLRLTDEVTANRQQIEEEYAAAKERAGAKFKEARWTIITLHESDKRVAREQLLQIQQKLKESRAELKAIYLATRRLIRSWKFATDLQVQLNYQPRLAPSDPWKNLEQRRDIIYDCRDRLRELVLPRLLEGRFLLLTTLLAGIGLGLPAFFVTYWYLWVVASTLTVFGAGRLARYWMTKKARTRIALLWQGLSQAVIDGKPIRQLCLHKARQEYQDQRKQSRARHRATFRQAIEKYRHRKHTLKTRVRQRLAQLETHYQAAIAQIVQQRDVELESARTRYDAAYTDVQTRHETEAQTAEARQLRILQENDARHERDWYKLVEDWQAACQACDVSLQAIEQTCRRQFPPWEELAGSIADGTWQPPTELPDGLPIGTMEITPELVPHHAPEDARLPTSRLAGATLPALLPFPEQASILFKAVDRGREIGIRALEALLLRSWTSLPPGKLRCTIIDPVGRGENFAAFMHLADQDESLINSRIWTEPAHIDQRLADLTTHMETVLQKFLRNRYQTLAEYNLQAGEVAEPFRLLVVAHFPVNFSTDAARRLISLAGAGARCGIYVLVLADAKQEMPHGVEFADLEDACINLVWREGSFRWRDPDFGDYPLTLTMPPAAEVCTSILAEVGEKARLANRVEVPFESIAPPQNEFWTTDSRGGISVPLGRAGATELQMLSLGKGTSQHVLIAGKTGSGKSTLLHVLITQLALRYSPEEVELYLIDFKKGVEFKTYASHQLPHARVVAVESEREFGLSVLQRLDAELVQRGELFRQLGVNDLPSYREFVDKKVASGQKPVASKSRGDSNTGHGPLTTGRSLPRILLIVDEFQEFFIEDDKIAQETVLLMDRLVRQGRAFGIHIILGSQTLGGAYSLARSTIDQMAVRIALQCSEADAHLILSKENSEARLLDRPGEAIYNAANGMLEGNNLFQIVWITDKRRDDYLVMTHEMARRRALPNPGQIVFEGAAPSNLAGNPWLERLRKGDRPKLSGMHCWLGEAVAIKDPTAAVFRAQGGANLLMVGQNGETAFRLMVSSLVSLAMQRKSAAAPLVGDVASVVPGILGDAGSVAYVATTYPFVAGLAADDESGALMDKLPETLPVKLISPRDLPDLLSGLSEELQRRQKENVEGEPTFLFLYGLQRLRDLRRADDDFSSFSRRGEEKPSPAKLFQTLAREGPPLGMHIIVWCDTMTNLQRIIDRQGLREFEMRVLFSMNAADSSSLMDSPQASKLGPHRALFYTEDQGKAEKFRPYGLPSLEWLRKLTEADSSKEPRKKANNP